MYRCPSFGQCGRFLSCFHCGLRVGFETVAVVAGLRILYDLTATQLPDCGLIDVSWVSTPGTSQDSDRLCGQWHTMQARVFHSACWTLRNGAHGDFCHLHDCVSRVGHRNKSGVVAELGTLHAAGSFECCIGQAGPARRQVGALIKGVIG